MKVLKHILLIILLSIFHYSQAQDFIEQQVFIDHEYEADSAHFVFLTSSNQTAAEEKPDTIFFILEGYSLGDDIENEGVLSNSVPGDSLAEYFTHYLLFDTLYSHATLYHRGYTDGRTFYKNKGIFWSAFGLGVVTPFTYFIPGLAAGTVMAAVPPSARTLRYHDNRMLYRHPSQSIEDVNHLFDDMSYTRGYQKGAHNKKLGSVAGGMGAGMGVSIALVVIIVASILSSW